MSLFIKFFVLFLFVSLMSLIIPAVKSGIDRDGESRPLVDIEKTNVDISLNKKFSKATSIYLDEGAQSYLNSIEQVQGDVAHAVEIVARKQFAVCGKPLSVDEVKNLISNDGTVPYVLYGILENNGKSLHADYQRKVNDMKCLTSTDETLKKASQLRLGQTDE
ncbi:hypothetical protein [Serratia plymuthica]|uniref:hypothetical protein n=1 Tax=Serratia plymuthica TaxID=82996 RepID=UPI00056C04CF|nr:hypothetical protein [Serratia plymuthica]